MPTTHALRSWFAIAVTTDWGSSGMILAVARVVMQEMAFVIAAATTSGSDGSNCSDCHDRSSRQRSSTNDEEYDR